MSASDIGSILFRCLSPMKIPMKSCPLLLIVRGLIRHDRSHSVSLTFSNFPPSTTSPACTTSPFAILLTSCFLYREWTRVLSRALHYYDHGFSCCQRRWFQTSRIIPQRDSISRKGSRRTGGLTEIPDCHTPALSDQRHFSAFPYYSVRRSTTVCPCATHF